MRQTVVTFVVPTEDWAAVQRALPKGSIIHAETLDEGLEDAVRERLAGDLQSTLGRAAEAQETATETANRLTREANGRGKRGEVKGGGTDRPEQQD